MKLPKRQKAVRLQKFYMRATKGIRTLDLAFTKRLLYRLSYGGL